MSPSIQPSLRQGLRWRQRCGQCLRTLFAASLSGPAFALQVPAGSFITNVASVDSLLDLQPVHIVSNSNRLRIDEVLDVALSATNAGLVQTQLAGDSAISARLSNLGNGTETFYLKATAGPLVEITGLAIDNNANGIFDATADTLLAADGGTGQLSAASAATILILLKIKAGADDPGNVTLTATAATGSGRVGRAFDGGGDGGGDAVVGTTSAKTELVLPLATNALTATLTKSQSVSDPQGGTTAVAGAVITYSLSAAFAGHGRVTDVTISDPVPAGTRYVTGSLRLDGSPLSDGDGDGTSVTVALGTITGPAVHTVTFQSTIR